MNCIPHFDNLFWSGIRDYIHEVYTYYKSGTDRVCRDCAIFSEAMVLQVRMWQVEEGQFVKQVAPYQQILYHQMLTPEMKNNAPVLNSMSCDTCHKDIPKVRKNAEKCLHCRKRYAKNWEYFQNRPFDVQEITISEI